MGLMDRLRETFQPSRNEAAQNPVAGESTTTHDIAKDREHIQSIVGIPQARQFEQVDAQGDIRKYVAENGSRINVDSKGQFYDGELRPLDRDAASTYQRMTTEWQSHPHDDVYRMKEHLKQFTQPVIDQYLQEQHLGGLQNANSVHQTHIEARLQNRLGLTEDSAALAVSIHVLDSKRRAGVELTADENSRGEYYDDVLRGKEGVNAARSTREHLYAEKYAEPALKVFAAEHNVAVADLSVEQADQVAAQISRRELIPIAIATMETRSAHYTAWEEADQRADVLKQGVGAQNAEHYTWKQNSGDIDSYQHNLTGRFVHLDSNARFYDQHRSPVDATAALSHAEEKHTVAPYNEHAIGSPDPTIDRQMRAIQTQQDRTTNHTLPLGPVSLQMSEIAQNPFTEQLWASEIAAHKELSARVMAAGLPPSEMKESLSALIDTWNQDKVNLGYATPDEAHGKERWVHANAYIEQFTKQQFESPEQLFLQSGSVKASSHEQSVSLPLGNREGERWLPNDHVQIQALVGMHEARQYGVSSQQTEIKEGVTTFTHVTDGSKLHLDTRGQFYSQEGKPIDRETAYEQRLPTAELTPSISLSHDTQPLQNERRQDPTDASPVRAHDADRDTFRQNRILEYSVGADRTEQYEWKQTSGNIESFQNKETGKYLHADNEGRFYNQERKEIPQATAIQHAEPDRLVAPASNGIHIPVVAQAQTAEVVRSDSTVAAAPAIDKASVQEHSLSM